MLIVCARGRGLWSPMAKVCMNWMRSAAKSAHLNWSAELRVLQTDCMEQSAICHAH